MPKPGAEGNQGSNAKSREVARSRVTSRDVTWRGQTRNADGRLLRASIVNQVIPK